VFQNLIAAEFSGRRAVLALLILPGSHAAAR
jgi:hypothetical protein